MKIACPIQNLKEIEPLAEAGVDEFYCGVLHSDQHLSHRPPTEKFNFRNLKELEEAIRICHSLDKDIWLTLNRRHRLFDYFPFENKLILRNSLDLFKLSAELKLDGVIIADTPLLLEAISQRPNGVKIAVSTVLPTLNSESITFFKELGCQRTILERQMTIREIQSIDENIKDIELEIFFDLGCVYMDAFCRLEPAIGIKHFYKSTKSIRPCRFPLNISIYQSKLKPEKGSKILSSLKRRIFGVPVLIYGLSSLFYYTKLRNDIIFKLPFRGFSLTEKLLQLKILKSTLDFLITERKRDYESYFDFLKRQGLLRHNFEDGYFKNKLRY